MNEEVPIRDICGDLLVHALDEGDVVLEVMVHIKTMNADGSGVCWYLRRTKGVDQAEAIGILVASTDRARRDYLDGWLE